MKNKELIKKLQEFDPEMEVIPYTFEDYDNIVFDIGSIKIWAQDCKGRIYKWWWAWDPIEEWIDANDACDGYSDEEIKIMYGVHNVLLMYVL